MINYENDMVAKFDPHYDGVRRYALTYEFEVEGTGTYDIGLAARSWNFKPSPGPWFTDYVFRVEIDNVDKIWGCGPFEPGDRIGEEVYPSQLVKHRDLPKRNGREPQRLFACVERLSLDGRQGWRT